MLLKITLLKIGYNSIFLPECKYTKNGNFCVDDKHEMSRACESVMVHVGVEGFLLMSDIV